MRITTAGMVNNYTSPGIASPRGITAGPDGAMWFTNEGNNTIGRITPPPSVRVLPKPGKPKTGVSLSASGFQPGETGNYATRPRPFDRSGHRGDDRVLTTTMTNAGPLGKPAGNRGPASRFEGERCRSY